MELPVLCLGLSLQLFLTMLPIAAIALAETLKKRIKEVERDLLEQAGEIASLRTQLASMGEAPAEPAEFSVLRPSDAPEREPEPTVAPARKHGEPPDSVVHRARLGVHETIE